MIKYLDHETISYDASFRFSVCKCIKCGVLLVHFPNDKEYYEAYHDHDFDLRHYKMNYRWFSKPFTITCDEYIIKNIIE